jgi:predicted dehydrogenase
MSLKKTKIAIIGAGEMANEYLKVLSKYKHVEVVGIYNRTLSKSLKLKKKFKIKQIFKKIDEMYEISKPAGVIVAISPDKLNQRKKEIFNQNIKYLVEKPIGLNQKESLKIYKFARKNKIEIYVGLNRRFYASTKYLIKKIKNRNLEKRIVEIEDQQEQIINRKIFSKKILDNYMYVNSIHLIDYYNFLCRGKLIKIKKNKKLERSEKKHLYLLFIF